MLSFRRLAIASTAATFVLVFVGGLVRATGSGLGCGNDWPVCNGKVIPFFDEYTVVLEYSHRVLASVVAVLLGALLFRAFKEHRERPAIVRTSMVAFGLVLFQAGLGMVVVKMDLEAVSVVLHLGTAMILFGVLVWLVVASQTIEGSLEPTPDAGANRAIWFAAGGVLALLLIGSYVSGRHAGNVFTDWPLMDGRVVPDLSNELMALHFLHRAVAAVVGVVVLFITLRIARRKTEFPLAAKLAHVALGLFVVEVMIGAINVWTNMNSASVSIHLALAALIWASLVGAAVVTQSGLKQTLEARPRAGRAALETSGS